MTTFLYLLFISNKIFVLQPDKDGKTDGGVIVSRISEAGPAEVNGLRLYDQILQVRVLVPVIPHSESCFLCDHLYKKDGQTSPLTQRGQGGTPPSLLLTIKAMLNLEHREYF